MQSLLITMTTKILTASILLAILSPVISSGENVVIVSTQQNLRHDQHHRELLFGSMRGINFGNILCEFPGKRHVWSIIKYKDINIDAFLPHSQIHSDYAPIQVPDFVHLPLAWQEKDLIHLIPLNCVDSMIARKLQRQKNVSSLLATIMIVEEITLVSTHSNIYIVTAVAIWNRIFQMVTRTIQATTMTTQPTEGITTATTSIMAMMLLPALIQDTIPIKGTLEGALATLVTSLQHPTTIGLSLLH